MRTNCLPKGFVFPGLSFKSTPSIIPEFTYNFKIPTENQTEQRPNKQKEKQKNKKENLHKSQIKSKEIDAITGEYI